jgi:hypothetical protein
VFNRDAVHQALGAVSQRDEFFARQWRRIQIRGHFQICADGMRFQAGISRWRRVWDRLAASTRPPPSRRGCCLGCRCPRPAVTAGRASCCTTWDTDEWWRTGQSSRQAIAFRVLARNGPPGMLTIWSLSGPLGALQFRGLGNGRPHLHR